MTCWLLKNARSAADKVDHKKDLLATIDITSYFCSGVISLIEYMIISPCRLYHRGVRPCQMFSLQWHRSVVWTRPLLPTWVNRNGPTWSGSYSELRILPLIVTWDPSLCTFSFQPSDAGNRRIFPTGSWRENVKHSGAGPSYNSLSASTSLLTSMSSFDSCASPALLCHKEPALA